MKSIRRKILTNVTVLPDFKPRRAVNIANIAKTGSYLCKTAMACLLGLAIHCGSDGGGGGGGPTGPDSPVGSLVVDRAVENDVADILAQFSDTDLADIAKVITFTNAGGDFRIVSGIDSIGGLDDGVDVVDGPAGVIRPGKNVRRATVFPAPIGIAASWDMDLVAEMGKAMAIEVKTEGAGVLLAPGVNLYRIPHNGRSFEYYGEDPYLVSQVGVAFIKSVQAEGIVSTIKHYCCNNVEFDRNWTNSKMHDRTLHEIYLPAYRASVEQAGVWSMMGAYNHFDGVPATESTRLLNILRGDWNFRGFVMSDWLAVRSSDALAAGTDLEMPNPTHFNQRNLEQLLNSGRLENSRLDDAMQRIFRALIQGGVLDYSSSDKSVDVLPSARADWAAHNQIALKAAQSAIVLLKNEANIKSDENNTRRPLPINPGTSAKVLVMGNTTLINATPRLGSGSGNVRPGRGAEEFTTGNNIETRMRQQVAGTSITLDFEFETLSGPSGAITSLVADTSTLSADIVEKIQENDFIIIPVGYTTTDTDGSGFRASGPEGENKERFFQLPPGQDRLLEQTIAAIAADSDGSKADLIVTITAGGGVEMNRWIDNTDAVLHSWYMGQAVEALVQVIFGEVNPSAKLPISIERLRKHSSTYNSYELNTDDSSTSRNIQQLIESSHSLSCEGNQVNPGTSQPYDLEYGEELFVGYRHFDRYLNDAIKALYFEAGGQAKYFPNSSPNQAVPSSISDPDREDINGCTVNYHDGLDAITPEFTTDITPLFHFGHGLSYTTYSYGPELNVERDSSGRLLRFSFDIENSGSVNGAEIAQLYVRDVEWNSNYPRPYKELKGFAKSTINVGQSSTVNIDIDAAAFAYYNDTTEEWAIDPGQFEIQIGSSSNDADIHLRKMIEVTSFDGSSLELTVDGETIVLGANLN